MNDDKFIQKPVNISGAFIPIHKPPSHPIRIGITSSPSSKTILRSDPSSPTQSKSQVQKNNTTPATKVVGMDITLENLLNMVNSKIVIMNLILDCDPVINSKNFDIIKSTIFQLILNYNNICMDILPKYSKVSGDNILKVVLQAHRLIERDCIINNMDWIIDQVSAILPKSSPHYKLIYQYNSTKTFSNIIEKLDYLDCPTCNVQRTHYLNSSELKCPLCGQITTIDGIPSTEYQMQDVPQQNTYDINRRFLKIINEVLAKTPDDPPKFLMDALENIYKLERIPSKTLVTCGTIRRWLKEINHGSKYNRLVPKIHKIFTGIQPPELLEFETNLIYNCYVKVIVAFFNVKEDEVKNSPYCRYFIYKIVSVKIANIKKRHEIMDRIHTQEEDTVKKNDEIWAKLCDNIDELRGLYKPTNIYRYT